MLAAAFGRFLAESPLCVMARLSLESLFEPRRLDALFRACVEQQYERELLFSQVVELMSSVVLRVEPSVHAAYRKRAKLLRVSDQALYDKLQGLELGVSQALVADSAMHLRPVIDQLQARRPPWLPGYRTRIIDGNHLSASERRLRELRQTWARGLPGKVLAVYEQETDLITDVFLTPDGHDQECTLFDPVLVTVQPHDLWIADRAYGTLKFLFGVADRQAAFVIRQHGAMTGHLQGERRPGGAADTGTCYEQPIELRYQKQTQIFRRITLVLDQPTRDGDTEIHVLTNLPATVSAVTVVELYRRRWTIEKRFYEMAQTLEAEPNTLGYPKAALFAFCLALVASNAMALLKAALRAVHGLPAVEHMSDYYMGLEIQQTYVGMMIALPPAMWKRFAGLTADQWANVLRDAAAQVQPTRYRKARRGPKKKPTRKAHYQNGGHVSTHKLIQKRQK